MDNSLLPATNNCNFDMPSVEGSLDSFPEVALVRLFEPELMLCTSWIRDCSISISRFGAVHDDRDGGEKSLGHF